MNIDKFYYNPKFSPFENGKISVMMQAMSYTKIYELFHKQIWRKAPYRISSYANPYYPMHNGRPVRFVSMWNIKSPQTVPYTYGGGDYTFGLNQLFMGQDYRKTYIGNPKNGIYHDDCFIQPKPLIVTSGKIMAWSYYSNYESGWDSDSSWEIYTYDTSKFYAENVDSNGQTLTANSVYETYIDGTTQKHRVIKTLANGSTVTVELGIKTDVNSGIHFAEVKAITGIAKTYVYHFDLTGHGIIVHEEYSAPSFNWTGVTDAGWTKCYEDGTVVQYNPETHDSEGGGTSAHYIVLPMMYTDTGDLAMDKTEFVEKWNDYFELIVREDSEWWQMFVRPILAIIVIIISYFFPPAAGLLTVVYAIGVICTIIGIFTGDKGFGLLGAVMTLGATAATSVASTGAQAIENQVIAQGFSESYAVSVASSASFGEIFAGYLSTTGMSNILDMGIGVLKIGNDISNLNSDSTQVESSLESKTTKVVLGYSEDENEYDVYGKM